MNSTAAVWYEGTYTYNWNHDWNLRMNLATPGDTARGLFFNSTLEAIRVLGGEELVKRCLESCGQERFIDFFTYPVSLQLRIISTAMQALQKRYGSPEGALRHLGRCLSMGFLGSSAGQMLVKLAAGDPKRLLEGLSSAYRVSLSYGQHSVRWTGPRSGCFLMRKEFMPHPVHEGVLATLLEVGGAREVKVWGRPLGPLDAECEFTWS